MKWDVLPATTVHYTAVEPADKLTRLTNSFETGPASARPLSTARTGVTLSGVERVVIVEPVATDAVEHVETNRANHDLLVTAALLDIVDNAPLSTLPDALDTGGLYYSPLIFNGATRFRPQHPTIVL